MKLECPETSDTGAYKLTWGSDGDQRVEVFEIDPGGGRRLLYEGLDGATTVSGRSEGLHVYEVHGADTTARCEVDVAPPSLTLAFALFAVGLVITGSTVGLIIWGHRKHRRGEIG